jgi:SpoVK/Ycf46/Vps4 family AAA+-type ATPase
MDSLIGMESVKKKIRDIADFIVFNNKRYVELNIENPGLYYNFVISGGRGTGKNTIAKIIYHLMYQLGVIGNGKLINIDSKEVYPGNTLDRYLGNAQSGTIVIDDAHVLEINDKRGQKNYQGTFDNWFTQYKDNFIFIIAGEPEGINNIMKEHLISKHINFRIDIPDYSDSEILDLIRHFAKKEKYEVDSRADEVILNIIEYYREIGCFENIYTAKNIVERAIIKKALRGDINTLTAEDFNQEEVANRKDIKTEEALKESDPFEELKNMIGLSEAKQRVEEIAAFAAAQLRRKELGLEKETVCLHMDFAGSPGTGKTTVARIIGRIFKKLGILSKGHFVEVSREDLVGKYVGHTAVKTAEKIKEAEGGILFVDEAYSLASESRVDFGYEAISTFVKKMEDMRNNLVVIFAGYQEEMKGLMNMNPGLKDRIQFNVMFNDYKPSELMEIWTKFFKDNNYTVSEEAVGEMNKIVQILYDNKTYNFANGRVMRKCFERARIHQAVRIMREKYKEIEDLMKIEVEDISGLYGDKDVVPEVRKVEGKKCIGFIR